MRARRPTLPRRTALLGLASLALGACSSGGAAKDNSGSGGSGGGASGGSGGTDSGAAGAGGAEAGISPVYPPGPYGNNVGDTVPNLSWQGYVNNAADALSTTMPFGPYTMDDLRKSGRPLALLHLSEYF